MYPNRWRGVAVCAFVLIFVVAPRAFAGFTFTNIADTSLTAPGSGTFSDFSVFARLADTGTVYFQANAAGGPSQAIYRSENGILSRVAAIGDAAPGGGTFTAVDLPSINAAGDLTFRASTDFFGLQHPDIYAYDQNGGRRIARYNQRVPGSDVARFDNFSVPTLSAEGAIAFTGSSGDSLENGIYRSDASGLTRILRNGDPAPGGGTFSFFGSSPIPNQNASGKIVFSGGTANAVYSYENGVVKRIVARDDDAPGGGKFNIPLSVGVADDGRAFFWGTAGTGNDYRYGFWSASPDGSLTQLVASGDAAPGGGSITGFQPPKISGSGDFAFWGYAGGKEAVFASEQSSLVRVIGAGDALFGSTVKTLSVDIGSNNRNASPTLNDVGQIVLYYELNDGRKGIALARAGGAAAAPEPPTLPLALTALTLFSAFASRRAVSKTRRINPAEVDVKR